jgi:hypothetical protein
MQLTDLIQNMGGLQSVASEFGLNHQDAERGAAALLPAILGGFQKRAQATEGVDGLPGMLNQLGGGGLLDNVLSAQPTNIGLGNDVLGQIFGGKDVSRTVAANAATQTGLDPSLLKKLLPVLAMMAAGYMAKQHAGQASTPQGGGLGGLLGGLLSGRPGASSAGGLGAMLDANGNGNPLDDILGMAGRLRR